MERPKWLTALPREYVLGWRSQVGALDGGRPDTLKVAEADHFEIRVGSDLTLAGGYFGLVKVTPERLHDPSYIVAVTRLAAALQTLSDLEVRASARGGFVVLETSAGRL